jgi:hypothetical protein
LIYFFFFFGWNIVFGWTSFSLGGTQKNACLLVTLG